MFKLSILLLHLTLQKISYLVVVVKTSIKYCISASFILPLHLHSQLQQSLHEELSIHSCRLHQRSYSICIRLLPISSIYFTQLEYLSSVQGNCLVKDSVSTWLLDDLIAVKVTILKLLEDGIGSTFPDHFPKGVFLDKWVNTEYGYPIFFSFSYLSFRAPIFLDFVILIRFDVMWLYLFYWM